MRYLLFTALSIGCVGDKDSDGDGLLDSEEEELGTDQENEDSDGDGFSDSQEVADGTDPLDPLDIPNPYTGDYPLGLCEEVPTGNGSHRVGTVADDFTLVDQYGEDVTLSDFCNSVVLLESSRFT